MPPSAGSAVSHGLSTPSPPRVRHSMGLSRYERLQRDTHGTHTRERSSSKIKHPTKQVGQWILGKVIGTGSQGQVRIARSTVNHAYAACKVVKQPHHRIGTVHRTYRDDTRAAYARRVLQREIAILEMVDHPHLMKLYDVLQVADESYLFFEYVPGGELFDYIRAKGALPYDEASCYLRQIACGLVYMHDLNLVHRDLKPENLLLDARKRIKIADFGMATFMHDSGKRLLVTSCGSPHYAAPEVVMGRLYDGKAADIWSLGVITFALLHGHLPFDGEDTAQVIRKVLAGVYKCHRDLPDDACDIIHRMLYFQPSLRIKSFAQTLTERNCKGRAVINELSALWGRQPERVKARLGSEQRNPETAFYRLKTANLPTCLADSGRYPPPPRFHPQQSPSISDHLNLLAISDSPLSSALKSISVIPAAGHIYHEDSGEISRISSRKALGRVDPNTVHFDRPPRRLPPIPVFDDRDPFSVSWAKKVARKIQEHKASHTLTGKASLLTRSSEEQSMASGSGSTVVRDRLDPNATLTTLKASDVLSAGDQPGRFTPKGERGVIPPRRL